MFSNDGIGYWPMRIVIILSLSNPWFVVTSSVNVLIKFDLGMIGINQCTLVLVQFAT